MPLLRLESVSCGAHGRRGLAGISLSLQPGACLTLLGAPESGHALLPRVIAGLESAEAGRILLDGQDIGQLAPRRRPLAALFEHDPLFGHPTVFDAVAGVVDGPDSAVRAQRLLVQAGLAQEAGSMPAMLPPPLRRRLALARALAGAPRLLLVSEGFGSADPGRPTPRRWLRAIQQRVGIAMILVARSAAEALELGDQVAAIADGRLLQAGPPETLLRHPACESVARLLETRPPAPAPGLGSGRDRDGTAMLEVVAPGIGMPARVLGATVLGATIRLDLELIADGRQIAVTVPSLGTGGALPAGSVIGVRSRTVDPVRLN